MIFEPAFAARLRSSEQEALTGESDLLRTFFSSWTHYTWILGEELWEAIQPAKTISRGKYLNQLYWMKVRSLEFYLAAFSLVGEADV